DWIRDEATPVRAQTGRPFVLQGVMYDISKRKHTEQELAEVLEKLRAMDRQEHPVAHALARLAEPTHRDPRRGQHAGTPRSPAVDGRTALAPQGAPRAN